MKKAKLSIFLAVVVTVFATRSTAQPGYVLVPDSLTCITPEQDIFNIEQAFTIREQATSLVLKDKAISILQEESSHLRNEVISKDNQINLQALQLSHCQGDKNYVQDQLHLANRSMRLFKTGFIIAVSAAITELGIIAFQRVVR